MDVKFKTKSKQSTYSMFGFSILEVLITTAIIGIIVGIITLKYGSFNNLILLKNQAYQVALELREAQTRSLSVTGRSAGTATEFRRPYGIYFSRATPDRYLIFLDNNINGYYNVGEEIETRRLDSRFKISRLCSGSNCALGTLSITFRRPNFDAIMNNGTVSEGKIEIIVQKGTAVRSVKINGAGQITVE